MYPTGEYRIETHHSKSLDVKAIRQLLTNLEVYDNYKPDVVIIDHAMLLKINSRGVGGEQVDEMFAELRGLATEFDIALLTATHSTRAGYKANMLDETQVGRSIAILNHVTSCIALTATKQEREMGILRASSLVEREGVIHSDQVVILQALDVGTFHCDSRFLGEMDYTMPESKEE
jgi:RecA-family ATPase